MTGSAEPTLTTRERRRPEVTARLLRGIEELTADGETYADVSVARLAARAGISRATFYLYFSEKKALLRAWIADVEHDFSAALAGSLALDGDVTRADVVRTVSRIASAYRARASLIEAVYNEAARDVEMRGVLGRLVRHSTDAVRAHIERGQEEGWVDPALLPAETAAWLVWLLQSGLRDLVAPSGEPDVDALVETGAEVWWNVLYADAPCRTVTD